MIPAVVEISKAFFLFADIMNKNLKCGTTFLKYFWEVSLISKGIAWKSVGILQVIHILGHSLTDQIIVFNFSEFVYLVLIYYYISVFKLATSCFTITIYNSLFSHVSKGIVV